MCSELKSMARMSNEEKTDPGLIAQAKNWTKDANTKADPVADSLLERIKSSPWSIAIIGVTHTAAFCAGLWAAWPRK